MSQKIQAAREAGYEDEEIIEYLSSKDSNFKKKAQKAIKEGYKPREILEYIQISEQPSKIRSFISAPIKGALKSAQRFNPLQAPGPITGKRAQAVVEQILPTREEHAPLERAGELAPYVALGPEGLISKGAQLAGGTLLGELAKRAGGGQTSQALAEAAGMGLPGLAKAGIEGLTKAAKGLTQKNVKTMPSGLTELRAVDKKGRKVGTLSTDRQSFVIDKLNKEASELAKKSVEKNLPISKQIEKGINFREQFQNKFSELEKTARKYNPEINISPINQFLRDETKKFGGIPTENLSSEARKIIRESKGFRSGQPSNLRQLYTLYRQNNRKIDRIYEKGRLTGVEKDYLNFLLDFNKEITNSFEKTFPENSSWLKEFKDLNKDFSNYMDARKVLNDLKGILSATPTKSEVFKLAENPQTQRKLALKMGKKGSEEIIQIAKDLKKSTEAIKDIPKSQLSKFDAQCPIYYFIPFIGKILGTAKTLQTAQKYGRYGYGYWMSTPKRRKIYQEAVKAINNNDLKKYKAIALEAQKELQQEED